MGGFSIWHWLIVGILVLLLFGKGRFSDMMGDVAKGLKSFKKGMAEDEPTATPPPMKHIDVQRVADAPPVVTPAQTQNSVPTPGERDPA
jgi:sec-independent protein translocase protein TatA